MEGSLDWELEKVGMAGRVAVAFSVPSVSLCVHSRKTELGKSMRYLSEARSKFTRIVSLWAGTT